MQCNSEKFQLGQIELLAENREGIKATLDYVQAFDLGRLRTFEGLDEFVLRFSLQTCLEIAYTSRIQYVDSLNDIF